MHARDQAGHVPVHGQQGQSQVHARRTSESPRMLFPTSSGGSDDPFSASPDEREISTESLPTAEEVEDKQDKGASQCVERLEKMEERQKRIEELLERIAQDVRK